MTPPRPVSLSLAPLACGLLLLAILPGAAPAGPLELTRKTLQSSRGEKFEAEAGVLTVPERRSVPGSREIPIRFLRLKSRAARPGVPLFFLAGGPGNRSVSERPGSLDFWAPFLKHSDVVLIDQRGTADSNLVWRWDGPPPLSFFIHADSARRHLGVMGRAAFSAFRSRGVDLKGYTTLESTEDLEALRVALGTERISLVGFSYGTHLAAAYLRHHGDRVESAVMIGTEGPDETNKLPWTMDTQFQKLALLTARDPALAGKIPDLVALYDRVIARLTREPMVIPVSLPGGRDTLHVPIGPFGLRLFLRIDVGDASDLVVFPRLLWSIEQGDPAPLAWFLNKRAGIALSVHGMSMATDAASGTSPERQNTIAAQSRTSRFADVVNFPGEEITAAWGLEDLGDGFRAPLVSPVRTLFISGALDFNTPPHQAEHMRWGMPDATHLIVENAGHEQTFIGNDSSIPVITDFLAGRDVRDRKITYPPLRFVPLEGNHPTPSHPSVEK